MKMTVVYEGEKRFRAQGANGSILIDAPVFSPVEHFAAGLMACSGVDVAMMAQKQGFVLSHFAMEAQIERNDGQPGFFKAVNLVYLLESDAPAQTVKRWVLASIESYCSTINTLRDAVAMTYTIWLNDEEIAVAEPIAPLSTPTEALFGICCPG